jgi:transposase InsO family protein
MRASSTLPTRAVRTTALRFGERCQALGIRCSMGSVGSVGSVGDGYDNAMAASCFATVAGALLARQTLRTQNAARTALFSSTAVFSNRQRRHSALGDLSPETYERRWATQTPVVA